MPVLPASFLQEIGLNRLRTACRFAWQGLRSAPQRAILALLGIVIGVAAVVALVGIGKSVEKQALVEFETMGTQVIQLSVGSGGLERILGNSKKTAAEQLPQRNQREPLLPILLSMPEVELAADLKNLSCMDQSNTRGAGVAPTFLTATRPELLAILGLKMEQGRFLHALDKHSLWVVLGYKAAQNMQRAGFDTRPGGKIFLCGKSMLVAGVLAPASTSESTIQLDVDNVLFLNMSAIARIPQNQNEDAFVLRVWPEVSPVSFALQLEASLAKLLGVTIQTNTAQKMIELRSRQAETYTRFLAALSGISLLVGALGILNIMLVAVIERRREIGIRMAVGADEWGIGMQFLMESTLLCLGGGVVGTVVGIMAAALAALFAQLPFVLSVESVVLAIGISLSVGVAAGMYPALGAARLDPVTSLQ